MGKSCTILAHVRNSKGEIVESRLFKDLLHYTSNRELAKEYYAVGTNEEFLSKVRDSEDFQTDENGEITFKSLRTLAKMDLETDKVLQVLNQDIGAGEYTYEDALRRVQEFNENNSWSDKMQATMIPSSSGRYMVSVVPKTETSSQQLHNAVRNKELEKKLIALLRSHGVSVKFLEGTDKGGRYSTENVSQMENGLYGLIEVNEKGTTTETFAEEAGHFAVGALGDNPLVQRLESLLGDKAMQREALGEEEFNNANLGNNPAREIAGRLVGKALMRKLDNGAPYKILANRIANLAKRVFYNFTGNEIRWAAAKAEQVANRIAYQFIEGNDKFSVQNAINIKETMLDAKLTMNQKVYRDTMDELGRMVKRLEAISQDQFTGQMQASLAMAVISGSDSTTGQTALQMVGDDDDINNTSINALADTFAFDGIVQALVQVTDYLGPGKEIDQMMKAVNLENPSDFYANMARNGRYLRQARTFIRSVEIILDNLDRVTNGVGDNQIKLANGSTIHDVKYQDENGTWRSIDLRNAIVTYRNIIAATKSELHNLESAYFTRFCEDIYGSKYITTTVGILWSDIWHGQKALGEKRFSIADMVEGEGMEDIDVLHRYLGAMSNNPDVIGQIADKLVKSANKVADDMTLRYQERLMILKERADQFGLNVADLVERDDNGLPTGNIITPPAAPTQEGNREEDFIYDAYMAELGFAPAVHHGRWEAERDEFKKQAWEDFKTQHPNWESMSGFTRGLQWDQFLRPKMKDWNAHHSIKVEVKDHASGEVIYTKWVPNLIYQSDQWDDLKTKYPNKNGDSLEQWVSDYLKIKEELDSMLPIGATVSHRLPQFRGTFMNSVRNAAPLERGRFKTANAWRKTFGRRVILESFVETSEDYDYGSLHTMNSPEEELLGTKLNYEEERAQRIPVFGINKMKNMQDLSTDLFHSMLSYAAMATSYQCLDNVVDGLEVGREALFNRELKGKQNWVEKGAKKLGDTFRSPTGRHESHDTGTKNRAYGRYIKFLDKQVYGISATYWGIPIGKGKRLLLNKLIQNISSLGGTLFLKGNVLGGAVNTLTGFNNIFKEAVTGEYFDAKDWAYAHKYYFAHFPEMWSTDLGALRKENKLSLFLEQMNAQSSNKEKFRNWKTTRSRLNNFYRMVGYLPYSSGDHYMQAMSYLAVAHGTKLYDMDGTEKTNLWDAYQREKNTDETGRFSSGKSLVFARFNPLSSGDITSDNLNSRGAFLKPVKKSTIDFEDWLVWQDSNFVDDTYKRNNAREYNNYRSQYDSLSTQELMRHKSEKYNLLTSILQKTEDYLNSNSPLAAVPAFDAKEQEYLTTKKVGTGNYADILQVVKDDIYSIIWTKADESAYMDVCREENIRNHGIYNEQDKTAWHQQWYTNAFLAMKGWALGYLEMMYSNNHYSTILGRNVEGFVNTAAKIPMYVLIGAFTGRSLLSWKDVLISMTNPWSKRSMKALTQAGFSEHQVFNARRVVASELLMTFLYILRLATAKPSGGDDDDEELDPNTGIVHYLSMRTLLEQEALLYLPETFVQTGQLMDFMPVGGAALYDLGKLGYEGVGAMIADEGDSDFYYQRDAKDGRYQKYDTKFEHHLERIVPYWKSFWAIQHPYEATDNYEFGRKLRTR